MKGSYRFTAKEIDFLPEKLDHWRREQIDAEFAEMRHDAQYGRESSILAQQFVSNDHDTLKLSGKASGASTRKDRLK